MMKPTRLPRPDWSQVIKDLEFARLSHEEIGAYCGRSSAWVQALKDFTHRDPRFPDGMGLLNLWCVRTGKTVAEVPTENGQPVRFVA